MQRLSIPNKATASPAPSFMITTFLDFSGDLTGSACGCFCCPDALFLKEASIILLSHIMDPLLPTTDSA